MEVSGDRVDKWNPKIIEDKKLRGEWAESVFMERATEHGLAVSKPWGEMRPYDFVVGKTGRFVSVQVKSTISPFKTGYACTVRGGHKAYPAGSFDFLAVFVILEDAWYIVPAALVQGKKCVTLFPHSKTAKYEPYREAWHLLKEASESPEEKSEAVPGEEAGSPPPQPRFPAGAMGRMQASFTYVRRSMERGSDSPKDDEES